MRVLVVDDDYVCRTKMKSLLSSYADCDAASDGEMALAMFEKAQEELVPYDLITMDIDMPGMPGQEVVQKIRGWEGKRKTYREGNEVKILMVTVRTDPESIVTSFRDGCEWYVLKPINQEKLQDAFARVGCGVVV